jgi:hypothetical protein
MGKFAEFCKGVTMGAFLLLLLAAGLVLGQDPFLPLRYHPGKELPPAAHHPSGVRQNRLVERQEQLPQACPPLDQRFLHETAPPLEEQIEEYIGDRQPLREGRPTERIHVLALVSAQERWEVGAATLEHDQLPIDNRASRQAAKHGQLGVAGRIDCARTPP